MTHSNVATNMANKIAVVTGGSSGIGSAIVNRFVTNGSKVISIDLKKPEIEIGEDKFSALKIAVKVYQQAVVPIASLFPPQCLAVDNITVGMGFVMRTAGIPQHLRCLH